MQLTEQIIARLTHLQDDPRMAYFMAARRPRRSKEN